MIVKNPFAKNKHKRVKDVGYFDYKNTDTPKTDKISICFLSQDLDVINANLIFKMIDDITEYITGDVGLDILKDILIVYDDTNTVVDRFSNYF